MSQHHNSDPQTYQESEKSRLFPDIKIKEILLYYFELAWNQGSSVALRQFCSKLN